MMSLVLLVLYMWIGGPQVTLASRLVSVYRYTGGPDDIWLMIHRTVRETKPGFLRFIWKLVLAFYWGCGILFFGFKSLFLDIFKPYMIDIEQRLNKNNKFSLPLLLGCHFDANRSIAGPAINRESQKYSPATASVLLPFDHIELKIQYHTTTEQVFKSNCCFNTFFDSWAVEVTTDKYCINLTMDCNCILWTWVTWQLW